MSNEFDSTTNTLFKRETKDRESKTLIIKINEIICVIILSPSIVLPSIVSPSNSS